MNSFSNSSRAIWSETAIFTFIQIIEDVKLSKQDRTGFVKGSLYDKVDFLMRKKGYNYQKCQLRNKWKKLSETYRSIINGTAKKSDDLSWPFFDAMHQVMTNKNSLRMPFDKDSIDPVSQRSLISMQNHSASFETASISSKSSQSGASEPMPDDDSFSLDNKQPYNEELMKILSRKSFVERSSDLIMDRLDNQATILPLAPEDHGNDDKGCTRKRKQVNSGMEGRLIKFLKKEKEHDREILTLEFEKLKQTIIQETDRIVDALTQKSCKKEEA